MSVAVAVADGPGSEAGAPMVMMARNCIKGHTEEQSGRRRRRCRANQPSHTLLAHKVLNGRTGCRGRVTTVPRRLPRFLALACLRLHSTSSRPSHYYSSHLSHHLPTNHHLQSTLPSSERSSSSSRGCYAPRPYGRGVVSSGSRRRRRCRSKHVSIHFGQARLHFAWRRESAIWWRSRGTEQW